MSYEIPGHKFGVLPAGADLSAAQYTFVKVNASAQIVQCSVSGEAAFGVLQNKPASGQACEIDRDGVSKLNYGGTVAAGGKVTSDSSGKGIAAGSGDYINGVCVETGAISGVIAAVAQRGQGKA